MKKFRNWIAYRKMKRAAKKELVKFATTTLTNINTVNEAMGNILNVAAKIAGTVRKSDGQELLIDITNEAMKHLEISMPQVLSMAQEFSKLDQEEMAAAVQGFIDKYKERKEAEE